MKNSEAQTYFLNLHSAAKGHLLIAKVVLVKARRLKGTSPESEALEVWRKLVKNLPLETIEALEKQIKRHVDAFYAAKSQLQVQSLEKNQAKKQKKYTCPECRRQNDGGKHGDCDMVLGRRGWRKLGEYDG